MIALGFRFLAGRYHATGWDHHVNEGTVEWPPSPWRLLRALVAASYKVVPALAPERARAALAPLVGLPVYSLPATSFGHTRHYMPLAAHRSGMSGDTALVFDAFAAFGPDAELVVAWPDAEASEPEELDAILQCVGYLGRSESWVEARRLTHWDGPADAAPASTTHSATATTVALPALARAEDYEAWRRQYAVAADATSEPGAKRGRRAARGPALPEDWWEVLHLDTGRLEREGWSAPPGVARIEYRLTERPHRASDAVSRPRPPTSRPTVARFALRSAVLPSTSRALPLGERARQALMSWSRDRPRALGLFSGKDAAGTPLVGHRHAFFLPTDDDEDGRLDHILVWAREGFPEDAVESLQQLRRLWGDSGHDLSVALVGLGHPRDYSETTRLLGPARTWESFTPFVPPRHPKRRGGAWVDAPAEQIVRLLGGLGLPTPSAVEALPARWHDFVRARRRGGGAHAGQTGHGFRLRFAEPVVGPIAVGYGAHQGLGTFVAVEH